jgi:serine/threonine protein kinase
MATLPRKFGDYYLIRKIATGGMAEVFLAQARSATGPDKYVALKLIHPRYQENENFHKMIVEEAKIAIQLTHKNIGQVFDLGHQDKKYFIVMEYVDGYDLSRLLATCNVAGLQVPFPMVAFIGREACAALSYAHNKRDRQGKAFNLIHRDMSPQNLMLSFDGECKLIDFGIAKVATRMQQTHAGVIKGKFYYMSPEQAGADKVDQRSDLFSLGICLWETLAGRSLFRREGGPANPLAILHEIRTMAIPQLQKIRKDCPAQLNDVIQCALNRDLSDRFQSATEMQAALNQVLLELAPDFGQKDVSEFMVQAYGKLEASKEIERVHTQMEQFMTRALFSPGDESILYQHPNEGEEAAHSASAIFSSATPKTRNRITDPDPSESQTTFIRDPEMDEPAPPPPTQDPNTRLIALDDIDPPKRWDNAPAHLASADPNPTMPLSQDPLFRLLVIGLLVLCVLSATLAYLLVRQSKTTTENISPQPATFLEHKNPVDK